MVVITYKFILHGVEYMCMFMSLEFIKVCGLLFVLGVFILPLACIVLIRDDKCIVFAIISCLVCFSATVMCSLIIVDYDGYSKHNYYEVYSFDDTISIKFLTDDIYNKYSEIKIKDKRMCSPRSGEIVTIPASETDYRTRLIMSGLPRDSDEYETFYSKYVINRLRC